MYTLQIQLYVTEDDDYCYCHYPFTYPAVILCNGYFSFSSGCHAAGVSNCYVFKSRLQEFAQKVGLPTPVYETTKEGPSHEPTFRSTVVVNDQRYDSLPGFFNRKAAEQSAAEVALMQLAQTTDMAGSISQPVVMSLTSTFACYFMFLMYIHVVTISIPFVVPFVYNHLLWGVLPFVFCF